MQPTPWYHWPVAILALLWHAGGALDYALTQFRVEAYLAQFTPEQVAYFQSLPAWVDGAWGIGVWIGLLGAWLLFTRSGLSVLLLAASAAALIAATVWLIALSEPTLGQVTGPVGVWIMLGAAVASVLFYLYARAMRQRGVLT